MAQFRKGQSGNPAGRPRGALNLLSRSTKANVQQYFEDMGGLRVRGVGQENPT